jgi:threonine aldolase
MAVSLTQQTESGTLYPLEAVREIAAVAKANGLPLHMDGARFANALARTGATPAEMTWKAGVDILSFGATKNGCVAAEAVLFFDTALARDMELLRKRAGQLFSKTRFMAAQIDAYLADDLWLDLARHSNAMADRLRDGFARSAKTREAWPTTGNEVFVAMSAGEAERLRAAGARFHTWTRGAERLLGEGETLVRFVTAFATSAAEVDRLIGTLG